MISTHAPAGGATSSHEVLSCRRIKFLLTPLREGRRRSPGFSPGALPISTHAPAGGATAPTASAAPPRFHFYSRPCGRGDYIVHHKRALTPISTHAPAGGATSRSRCCHRSPRYFYSRPCWRGDSQTFFTSQKSVIFLLTPLREGRLNRNARYTVTATISTHAPAGGATTVTLKNQATGKFLLTPLREGRHPPQQQG